MRRMTAATRLPVHTCPRKPYASGPSSTRAGSWASCSVLRRGCRPGAGWRAQSVHALLASPLEPLADGAGRDSEGRGDVLLFPAVFFQLPGALSPSLAPVELRRLRAHATSVAPL